MPLHTETRAGGRKILVDDNGFVVSHTEVRNGIAYYYSAEGILLEQKPITKPRYYVCTACGYRCEASGYIEPDQCHAGKHANWIETPTLYT